MRQILSLLLLAALFLALTRFRCERCSGGQIPVRITQSYTAQLDNRGPEPVTLAPDVEGFLNAYGFRFFIDTELQNPADTLVEECTIYYLDPYFSECRIFTLAPIPGSFPAGADVSELFRYVDRSGKVPEYRSVQQAASDLSTPLNLEFITPFDFLLVTPAATEGWYQFELRLTDDDSTVVSTTTQPIYLK